VNQWGVAGEPSVGEQYNYLRNIHGAIVQPQPGEVPLYQGLSNIKGTMAFSTSYLEQPAPLPALSRNATAELFVNLVDNARLDQHHFIVVGVVVQGEEVPAKAYSYGRMADECTPPDPLQCPGPDNAKLYAQGNAYLEKAYPKMDSVLQALPQCSLLCTTPGPCMARERDAGSGRAECFPYSGFDPVAKSWRCPIGSVDSCGASKSAGSTGSAAGLVIGAVLFASLVLLWWCRNSLQAAGIPFLAGSRGGSKAGEMIHLEENEDEEEEQAKSILEPPRH